MKNFIEKFGGHCSKAVAGITGLLALLVPALSYADFGSGMIIPEGTTTSVTGALDTYFFTTVLKTVFQAQVIQIVVVLAAVVVMWKILKMVIRKVMHPGR